MPEFWEFPVMALATWRLAVMLASEAGPFDVFLRLRTLTGIVHDEDGNPASWPNKILPALLSCVACLSVWMAGFVYLVWWLSPIPVWILGMSAVATLVYRRL